ncbi:MAG: FecR domain-containing protein, partial [Sphingomicrobium sp.]
MRKLILIVISAFALLGTPAFAKDAGSAAWIVSQLSGDARVVHPGLQPASLKAQTRLDPGDRIVTGLTGRATLTRGADYIIVAPHSELQLPTTPAPTGFTRVIQNIGTMLFKVKHTGIPHFAVDTPMLAAVVKGTTFTVVVGPDRSAVQVIQGKVEVTAMDGGMSRLVEGGKTVFIDRNEPKRLIDADQRSPAATTSSATAVRVTATQAPTVATIASLTGGLLQPGSQASVPAST